MNLMKILGLFSQFLSEVLLMSTYNICLYEGINKVSQNYHQILLLNKSSGQDSFLGQNYCFDVCLFFVCLLLLLFFLLLLLLFFPYFSIKNYYFSIKTYWNCLSKLISSTVNTYI